MSYVQAGGTSVACPSFIGNTAGTAVIVVPTSFLLLVDGVSFLLLVDGVSLLGLVQP